PTSNEEETETENNTNPESHGNSNDEHEPPPPLLLTLLLVFAPKPVKEQIAGADSENDILNIKDQVMADLEAKKKAKKEAKNLANNLETKGKDAKQLKKQLEEVEKSKGQQSYEDNQVGVDNLKNELAQKVSEEEYCQIIVDTIEKNMAKYDIKEQELEPEIKADLAKLKSREIKDNNQINEIEKKVAKNVGQKASTDIYEKSLLSQKGGMWGKNVSVFVGKAIVKELEGKEKERKNETSKDGLNNMNKSKKQSSRSFPHYGEIYLVYFNPKKAPISDGDWENLAEVQALEVLMRVNSTNDLDKDSKILLNHLRAIDVKLRLRDYVGVASKGKFEQVNKGLEVVLKVGKAL
ncbi:18614_t:CDS:2, partial [Funneliformis geosporum]